MLATHAWIDVHTFQVHIALHSEHIGGIERHAMMKVSRVVVIDSDLNVEIRVRTKIVERVLL